MMTKLFFASKPTWAHCRGFPAGSLAGGLCNSNRVHSRVYQVLHARRGLSELLSLREPSRTTGSRIPLRPHTLSPRLPVPDNIKPPPYVKTGDSPWLEEFQIQDSDPGITTDDIDKAVHQMIIENGAYPSPLLYGGFPKSVCTSVNECVCHGIPDSRALQNGDILNIDVTVYLEGYHGDTSRMFYVGDVSAKAQSLCEVTLTCLEAAIKECGPGVPIRQIGKVISDIADRAKFGVVQDFVGHGVGRVFHSLPVVQHGRNSDGTRMVEGMTFTIEPMLTEGSKRTRMWDDKWTIVTADGKLSAQYEHTILITKQGHEVLTTWPQNR